MVVGEQILAPIEFLASVRPLVRHGHERWDGTGYPDRLTGDAIPLGSRVIFVCDAFDAMTSNRPYRRAMPREARAVMTDERLSCGSSCETIFRAGHISATVSERSPT